MYAYGPSHLFKATILYEDIQQCRLTETPLFCTKTDSHAWEAWKWSEVAQSCPTPCGPVDCSPPGSSLHGILQARILEWVAISFSRGSSQPRDWTRVSSIAGGFFTIWATRETQRWTYMFTKEKSFCNRLSLRDWRYLQTFCSQSLLETVKLV